MKVRLFLAFVLGLCISRPGYAQKNAPITDSQYPSLQHALDVQPLFQTTALATDTSMRADPSRQDPAISRPCGIPPTSGMQSPLRESAITFPATGGDHFGAVRQHERPDRQRQRSVVGEVLHKLGRPDAGRLRLHRV